MTTDPHAQTTDNVPVTVSEKDELVAHEGPELAVVDTASSLSEKTADDAPSTDAGTTDEAVSSNASLAPSRPKFVEQFSTDILQLTDEDIDATPAPQGTDTTDNLVPTPPAPVLTPVTTDTSAPSADSEAPASAADAQETAPLPAIAESYADEASTHDEHTTEASATNGDANPDAPAAAAPTQSEPEPQPNGTADVVAVSVTAPPEMTLSESTPEHVADASGSAAHPDFIEKLFSRIEGESERRAASEAEAVRAATAQEVPTPAGGPPRTTRRRGGSVSVSRFGEAHPADAAEPSVPPTPSRLSAIVMQSPIYQKQLAAASQHTLSDAGTEHTHPDSLPPHAESEEGAADDAEEGEDTHVTQMQTVPGKQTLSRAMARRLSRARTPSKELLSIAPPLSDHAAVVIGVQVEARTVTRSASRPGTAPAIPSFSPPQTPSVASVPSAPEQTRSEGEGEQEEEEVPEGMTVHRPATTTGTGSRLRKRQSRLSMLVDKAKGLTRRLTGRKSRSKLDMEPATPTAVAA